MSISLISLIKPQSGGAFPVFEDIDGYGGYQVQPTTGARDAIPTLNRKAGMLVFVTGTNAFYQLGTNLTSWTTLPLGAAPAGGDLAGTLPNPTVVSLTGVSGLVTIPTTVGTGNVLRMNDVNSSFSTSSLTIRGANNTGSGAAAGGDVELVGGNGANGGAARLTGGNATGGAGGGVYMLGGTSTGTGGLISFVAGDGSGTSSSQGGAVGIGAGNSFGDITVGGVVEFRSGDGKGGGGYIHFTTGETTAATGGTGGEFKVQCGNGDLSTGNGGAVDLRGGNGGNNGGSFSAYAGQGLIGGVINLIGGDGQGIGSGGAVTIRPGLTPSSGPVTDMPDVTLGYDSNSSLVIRARNDNGTKFGILDASALGLRVKLQYIASGASTSISIFNNTHIVVDNRANGGGQTLFFPADASIQDGHHLVIRNRAPSPTTTTLNGNGNTIEDPVTGTPGATVTINTRSTFRFVLSAGVWVYY